MIGQMVLGLLFVVGAFLAFLILIFLSIKRVNHIKNRGLKTLREIKKGVIQK